jgi:hypothetical protein
MCPTTISSLSYVITPEPTPFSSTANDHVHLMLPSPQWKRNFFFWYRYAAAVVMALAYGKIPKSYFDPTVQAVNRCLARLGNNLRPGIWRVDNWPFLRYVSWGYRCYHYRLLNCRSRYIPGYLKELQDGHKEELTLFTSQLNEVREKMVRICTRLPVQNCFMLIPCALFDRLEERRPLSPLANI